MWVFPRLSLPLPVLVSIAKETSNNDKLTQALHRAADLADPKIRRRFREAADKLTDYDEQELIDALQRGDLNRALFILNIQDFPALFLTVSPEVTALAIRAVEITLANLATRRVQVDIVRVNPRAVTWARKYSSNLVVQIGEETRNALRTIVADGLQAGNNPRVIARDIRQVIGLTERQAKAVQNYRALLEAKGEKGIERKVERYAMRQLRLRAENIGRTEAIRAVSEAQQVSYETAYTEGKLPRSAKRKWISARGTRTCPLCLALNGKIVGINEPFDAGVMTPPRHPSCRCSTRIVF